jgi:hypothetical protein
MEISVYGTCIIHLPPADIKAPSALHRIVLSLAAALVVIAAASGAFASQLVLNSTGGSMSIGKDFVVTGAAVANPAGTISIDCPITTVGHGTYVVTYNCSGGAGTAPTTARPPSPQASARRQLTYLRRAGEKAAGFVTITPSPAISLESKLSTASLVRFAARPMKR